MAREVGLASGPPSVSFGDMQAGSAVRVRDIVGIQPPNRAPVLKARRSTAQPVMLPGRPETHGRNGMTSLARRHRLGK